MPNITHWLLSISNLVLAAAVSFHVFFKSAGSSPPARSGENRESSAAAAEWVLDLDPLAKPIETLDQSLAKFSSTLLRFNTTIVQYDFLQKEMERLARLDQALGMRLNLETAKKADLGEEVDENLDELIGQIRQIQAQVQVESERRRETMLKLIAGLERELATSSLDEGAVRDAIGDIPTAPVSDPVVPDAIPPVTPGNED